MTDFAQALNRDLNFVKTSARYDTDISKWVNDSALWVVGSGGILVPVGETNPMPVQQTGSNMDLRGKAADKPLATAVTIGATYWSVDTDPGALVIEVSDGTNWVVM